MTYRMPLRLTIRHFAQRFRMDGATLIDVLLCFSSQSCDYTYTCFFRPVQFAPLFDS